MNERRDLAELPSRKEPRKTGGGFKPVQLQQNTESVLPCLSPPALGKVKNYRPDLDFDLGVQAEYSIHNVWKVKRRKMHNNRHHNV